MNSDYERIARAIQFLEQHIGDQPSLAELAAVLELSPSRMQRLFQRWAGVSPKRFLQFLTVEYAKRLLEQSQSLLDVSYATGLSGPGRLHDHFVALEAVTPGEYKRQGADLEIHYGVHPSPFGSMFLATTPRGICALSFLSNSVAEVGELRALQQCWSAARIIADPEATRNIAERIFAQGDPSQPLAVWVKGTNFQLQVWQALLRIPAGALCAYEQIAHAIGRPSACRAVGQALAVNPVSYLIPCHRVIRRVGTLGGYRWGSVRKRALLAWEAAQCATNPVASQCKSGQTDNP